MAQSVQKIAIVRHGEVIKDESGVKTLTPKGLCQISATTEILAIKHMIGKLVYRVLCSNETRTIQCAMRFCEFHSLPQGLILVADGLHLRKAFLDAYGDDDNAYLVDIEKIQRAGGSIAIAREITRYARIAREYLEKFLVELASDISRSKHSYGAIGFSHSPYASLATPDRVAEKVPYQIEVGDAVIYTIKNGITTDAEYIPCPYK